MMTVALSAIHMAMYLQHNRQPGLSLLQLVGKRANGNKAAGVCPRLTHTPLGGCLHVQLLLPCFPLCCFWQQVFYQSAYSSQHAPQQPVVAHTGYR